MQIMPEQPKISRDRLWKGIIESRFKEFIFFFFPQYADQIDFDRPYEFLDKELAELFPQSAQNVNYVDKLAKLWLKDSTNVWFLAHIEVQGDPIKVFSERMFRYFYRIFDRYNVKITALAILTDDHPNWKPNTFEYDFMGTSNTYKYNVYKVLNQDREKLAANDNIFAIIMLTVYDALQNRESDEEKLQIKMSLARTLLSRGYSIEEVRDVFFFIKYYTSFAEPEYLRTFDSELEQLIDNKTHKEMGIEEYVISAYREAGLAEGMEKGMEKGLSMKERDFTLNLWNAQKFPLHEIALLVGISEEQVLGIISAFLQDQGNHQHL
jgi:hypothetical protein